MGFSVSASFAVAVIAGFIALGMLYPAVSGGFESVSQASQDAGERRLNAVNTDIDITTACYDAAASEVRVDVDNVGATSLGLNRTHVLIENSYQVTYLSRSVDGTASTGVWAPGQTLSLTYDFTATGNLESVPGEPGRLVVATEHGVRQSRDIATC